MILPNQKKELVYLFVDESGQRKLSAGPNPESPNINYFGMGGILINEEDIDPAKAAISIFRSQWPQLELSPLHSVDIRAKSKKFTWLRESRQLTDHFLASLETLLLSLPAQGLACVINKTKFRDRYADIEPEEQWPLCKTAFSILLERAAKYALSIDRRLIVCVESCGKREDRLAKEHFRNLKAHGHGFNEANSKQYAPLTKEQYHNLLLELEFKDKSSELLGIADLFLYPLCIHKYKAEYRPYRKFVENGKILHIEKHQDIQQVLGMKYFCFE